MLLLPPTQAMPTAEWLHLTKEEGRKGSCLQREGWWHTLKEP